MDKDNYYIYVDYQLISDINIFYEIVYSFDFNDHSDHPANNIDIRWMHHNNGMFGLP